MIFLPSDQILEVGTKFWKYVKGLIFLPFIPCSDILWWPNFGSKKSGHQGSGPIFTDLERHFLLSDRWMSRHMRPLKRHQVFFISSIKVEPVLAKTLYTAAHQAVLAICMLIMATEICVIMYSLMFWFWKLYFLHHHHHHHHHHPPHWGEIRMRKCP